MITVVSTPSLSPAPTIISLASPGVRPAAVAGSWYPADPAALARYVDGVLARGTGKVAAPTEPLRVLLAPHAGYRFSGEVAGGVFHEVRGRAFRRVVVIGPSHHGRFRGIAIPEVTAFQTPLGDIPLDISAITMLRDHPLVLAETAAHQPEHAIELQLPLLQRALRPGWRLLPILVGGMEPESFAQIAAMLRPWLDNDTLLVLSGDFTHFGPRYRYTPFPADEHAAAKIHELDHGALGHIQAKDAAGLRAYHRQTGITACALQPLYLALELLPDEAKVEVLEYATSGNPGDAHSVSYVGLAIHAPRPLAQYAPEPVSEAGLSTLRQLAEATVHAAARGDQAAMEDLQRPATHLPAELSRPAGAFVTIKKHGQLRGCIGFLQPQAPLAQAILANAVGATLRDRRFPPLQADELPDIEVHISVLSVPQPISGPLDFQPGEHGIIFHLRGQHALFLPEVATEQGWNRAQTLSHLARKAGLPASAWRDEEARFQVFTTQRYPNPG